MKVKVEKRGVDVVVSVDAGQGYIPILDRGCQRKDWVEEVDLNDAEKMEKAQEEWERITNSGCGSDEA